jgi:hypothetical protein
LKGNGATTGIMLGVAVVALAPVVLPALVAVGRPFAKAVIKSGLLLYERGRETFAEVDEVFEDLVAEVKAEVEQSQAAKAVAEVTGGEAPKTEG